MKCFPSLKMLTICDHTFLVGEVCPGYSVLDLGVNCGQFGNALVDMGAKVTGVEADPRFSGDGWRFPVVNGAVVGDGGGEVMLHYNGGDVCPSVVYDRSRDGGVKIKTYSLLEICDLCSKGHIGLVKMDIEGAELDVLEKSADLLFDRIDQISVEFHDFMDPTSLTRVVSVCDLMKSRGYAMLKFSKNDYSNVLFVNRKKRHLTRPFALFMLHAYRYCRMWSKYLMRS